jgi:hypothetical protein
MSLRTLAVAIFLSLVLASVVIGHPGGLDSNGGHVNRKTGEYHKHDGKDTGSVKPFPLESGTSNALFSQKVGTEQSINEYFRGGNENVGALSCGLAIYARDVAQSIKNNVQRRDGHKCVLCGSTIKLEVDHRRALMNGGTNDFSNLFTLCDDCHAVKTRMDGSLKRKRDKMCKGTGPSIS